MKHNYIKSMLAALLLLCCTIVSAHDFEVDGIFYNITDATAKTVEVTYKGNSYSEYNEYSGSVIIPSSVTYNNTVYSITRIGHAAFVGCSGLTSVEIPNSVTTIGDSAFWDCRGLTSVTIPNSVKSIGNSAFWGCTGLTSIEIPSSVTTIGAFAFKGCSGLTSITVNSGNSVYDSREGCNAIIETASNTLVIGCKNTMIPSSVTTIGAFAFDGCSGLTSVTIPNSVKSIGNSAFWGCTGLTSIEIPNSVTSIGNQVFSYCSGLTSITVNSGNSVYDSREGCNAIIETATNTLIAGCKNTIIPSSVTSIDRHAFYYCSGLTSIEIPSSVTSIGEYAFHGTAWYGNQPNGLVYAGNVLYEYKGTMPQNTSITIKNGVTSIGDWAFYGCSGLTSVEIPGSVTSIDRHAFYGCTGLTSIEIPNSVKSIGDDAFYECTGLTSVTIGNGVTSIGELAFGGCTGLTSITIPNSVTSIGYKAFDGCTGLTSVTIGNGVTSIDFHAFFNCTGLKTVYNFSSLNIVKGNTDNGYVAYYADKVINAPNGSIEGDYIFDVIDGVNTLCEYIGNGGDIVLPEDCNGENYVIGSNVFRNNTAITSVTIPDGVTSIGNTAFYYCTGLTSVKLGKNVTSLGDLAFQYCTSLNDITLPNSLQAIGKASLSHCGFTNVVIPNKVKTIGDYAFDYCENLAQVTIGNCVTGIGHHAFDGCENLKTVYNFSSLNIVKDSTDNGYVAYYADKVINAPYGHIEGDFVFERKGNFTTADGLPGTVTGSNHIWESPVINSSTNRVRITVLATNGGSNMYYYKGYPIVALGELEIYDGNGNKINYTASNVTTNSLEGTEGSLAALCDGNYSTFYHSTWSGTGTVPTDYVYIDIEFPQTVDAFKFKMVGRNTKALVPTEIQVTPGKYSLVAYTGNDTALVLPENCNGENYVISAGAFSENTDITSVTIPNSVTSIGSRAFWGCTGLTSVTIGNSVTTIGASAFSGCAGLTSIEIPSSVTSIGIQAFSYCSSLTSVTIPNSVTSIGDNAFRRCSGLASVEIPSSVTSIGIQAFSYCSSLTSISVNSGNSVYDSREGCNAIIETATNTLIAGCKNTIIPGSVTSIGHSAFYGCTGLTGIEIPNSVTSIGYDAFGDCRGLTSVTIPNSVTSIGSDAFNSCTGLTSITIPNSVTSIGNRAFSGCSGLTSITVNSDNSVYDSREGCNAIIETATNTLIAGCKNTIIPGSVTSIGSFAFSRCTGLTGIEIPNSVTSIGSSAFSGCTGLTSIEIPSSVTSIGFNTFFGCTGLAGIEIPSSVTSIENYAFSGCTGLTSIEIPNSVTSIGRRAFYDCSSLTEIYSLAKTPPTIDSSTFDNYSVTLYVPEGAKDVYQVAEYWKNFTNVVEMKPDAIPGDVNKDGRVSVSDITTVVDAILYESTDTAYDVNGDSRVSVADITTIVDIILNEGASAASKAPARVVTRSTSNLSLYIDPFEINAGEEKEILVNLSNPGTEITAVEFDLFLPEGLEVVSDEYGYYILPGSRTPNKRVPHAVSGDLLSSGAIHVICYHNSQLAFTGEDGDVVAITIKTADDLEPGNYTVDLKNIELVNPADPTNGILISDNNTVATDIENIEADEEGTTEIYDLNGRRVAEPSKGGIYIINGKKVVVK